jgi:hypothetical protein
MPKTSCGGVAGVVSVVYAAAGALRGEGVRGEGVRGGERKVSGISFAFGFGIPFAFGFGIPFAFGFGIAFSLGFGSGVPCQGLQTLALF